MTTDVPPTLFDRLADLAGLTREQFGQALWVVPRAAVMLIDDADILAPALDRGYRSVEGYRMREKFRAVEERLRSSEL